MFTVFVVSLKSVTNKTELMAFFVQSLEPAFQVDGRKWGGDGDGDCQVSDDD